MTNFKKFNIIGGWSVFAIAAFTYISTMEPTASLWDCGEFIATSYKLQVGHPPGAPFFMMLAKVVSLLAGGNITKVATMMNLVSALSSAFTILFLFWSISYIAKKIIIRKAGTTELSMPQLITIFGSATVGALAYTFSDSFWFSAVEAEVYALSSLFTAVVFWAILKWDEEADEKHADRWIVLIAYLMGLSIGVHLLNLLVIPAIALVYYFRKYKPNVFVGISVFVASFFLLLFVMYGVIQGLVGIGSKFELFFVNNLNLPFDSGFLFFIFASIGTLIFLLYITKKKLKPHWHTAVLSILVIIIGYSSFAMIVIRSGANPPIDENDPENTFALKAYLNREQYGDRPLMYGQYYDADAVDKKDLYTYIKGQDKYVKVKKTNPKYIYDSQRTTFFPRMYSASADHIGEYKKWGGISGSNNPTFINNIKFFVSYQIGYMYFRYFAWNFIGKQNDTQGYGGPINGNWLSGIPFIDNIIAPQSNIPDKWKHEVSRNKYFFLPFILGLIGIIFQFDKDKQSFWVVLTLFIMTGLAIVVYLNQTPLQPRERDYAYVGSFYAFAIWIGLSVLAVTDYLKKKISNDMLRSAAPFAIFLFVPILMAFQNWNDHDRSGRYHTVAFASNYLNSCAQNSILFTFGDNDTFPLWYAQEVEGIRTDIRNVNLSLFSTDWYTNQMRRKAYESDAIPISIDESKYKMGTRDVVFVRENPNVLFKEKYEANISEFEPQYISAFNYMISILENSNFPQIYANDYVTLKKGYSSVDIETFLGFVNTLSSNATQIGLEKTAIDSLLSSSTTLAQAISDAYAPIDAVMEFVLSDDPSTKLGYGSNEMVDYIPTKKILIPVDKQKLIDMGFITPDKYDLIGDNITFTLNKQYLLKAQWLILQILSENDWQRPIYFATSIGRDNYMGLQNYFRLEGFAYRLMPYKVTPESTDEIGEIDIDILYDNLMNKFTWGGISNDHFNVDHYVDRTVQVMDIRTVFHRLAYVLIQENRSAEALEVLDRCIQEIPDNKVEFSYKMIPIIEDYFTLGETDKALSIANIMFENFSQQINYFNQFKGDNKSLVENDMRISLYILQSLYFLAEDNQQTELSQKIEPILQANMNYLMN
ncbi:MAG: DUF2723 domain-containing protein [Bacteroidales bacterium]|nr:DUF2723 domain-containing protein [Bacteroidales bacterium]